MRRLHAREGFVVWLFYSALLLNGCASLSEFDPDSGDAVLIEDHVQFEQPESRGASVAFVLEVDGKKVSNDSRVKMGPAQSPESGEVALRLTPGVRKLKIRVCESGWAAYCGETYLRIEASPRGRYRLFGELSKSRGSAKIWIEDLLKGKIEAGPVQISGLRVIM